MNSSDESNSVVDPERLELPTPAFEAQCSIQLSYGSDCFALLSITHIVIPDTGFAHPTQPTINTVTRRPTCVEDKLVEDRG